MTDQQMAEIATLFYRAVHVIVMWMGVLFIAVCILFLFVLEEHGWIAVAMTVLISHLIFLVAPLTDLLYKQVKKMGGVVTFSDEKTEP